MEDKIISSCHFSVEWGGSRIGFTEVSGLDVEVEVLEYREGSFKEYTPIKIPAIKKYSNITFKRGLFNGDNEFFEWFQTIRFGTAEKRDITVKLLNENHEPVVIWKLKNAFPVKIEGPELEATKSEIAIETLEIAHEGIVIDNSDPGE